MRLRSDSEGSRSYGGDALGLVRVIRARPFMD